MAAQHAVHAAIPQFIIHMQARVLPAFAGLLFGQGHSLERCLCRLRKAAQILFRPFFLHVFIFPIICAQHSHTLCANPYPRFSRGELCSIVPRLPFSFCCREHINKKWYNAALATLYH